MKILGITLGSRRGEIEVRGIANVPKKIAKFQTFVNELLICEGDNYEGQREVAVEIFQLNRAGKTEESQHFPFLVPHDGA